MKTQMKPKAGMVSAQDRKQQSSAEYRSGPPPPNVSQSAASKQLMQMQRNQISGAKKIYQNQR